MSAVNIEGGRAGRGDGGVMGQEAHLQFMWSTKLRTHDRRQFQDKHHNDMWTKHPLLLEERLRHAGKSFNIPVHRLLLPPYTAQ